MPAGVVLPRSAADIAATLKIAAEHDVPVILRGGGTSQNGQPIGRGLVVDCSRHFNGIIAYDAQAGTITVEPGMVLERLNTRVKADGWFFPVGTLHRHPLHHRRHGRQQFLRRPLPALRQDERQRARHGSSVP